MNASAHTFKKHDAVLYSTGSGTVRGVVATVHQDGSLTVKAMFYLNDKAKDIPSYLGFKYRVWPADQQIGLRHRAG